MELYSAEAEIIQKRVAEWLTHPDFELEATFGATGEVSAVTFLAIAQRLRAKGFRALPQEDRLVVLTPEHMRFSLNSLAVIRQYCEDDTMQGKPFVAQIKDRSTADAQVDLEDYATRIKLRRETPIGENDAKVREILTAWPQHPKAFRMIRRWSFDGDGIRIDMSIVRGSKKTPKGDYRWQRRFRDQDIMAAAPQYEVEVELVHKEGDTAADATKRLIRGVGEVLRGIQKHSILLRKTTEAKIKSVYKELTGTDLFRGPALRTLQKVNFAKERDAGVPNLRDGYNVTDKADGLRCMGLCDGKGELFLFDMAMNVYRTGLKQPECRYSLIDGEWVTHTNDKPPKAVQQFLVFDIVYAPDKKDVSKYPFQAGALPPQRIGADGEPLPAEAPRPPEESRHFQMNAWVALWNKGEGAQAIAAGVTPKTRLQIAAKTFAFGKAGDDSIFRMAGRILSAARMYYTDGLIFTPNGLPLPEKPAATFNEQFKWKPPRDNTIDFLVVTDKLPESDKIDKVTVGVKPVTGETVSFKTLRLFVGGHAANPRDVILNKREIPRPDRTFAGKRGKDYKPIIFTPKEFPDPMASICNLEVIRDEDTGEEYVVTEHGGEPIQDKTIVEMSYDPAAPRGWRWKPLRVRMDKTEKLQRGILGRTLNAETVAEDVWNSIHDPITASMISTGASEPTQEEMAIFGEGAQSREAAARRYYDRKGMVADDSATVGMRKFHNEWIKEKILLRVGLSGEGKSLVDMACGVGGDMHKWRRAGAKFVFGVDYAAKNITDTADSAYTRYMKVVSEVGSIERAGVMVFAIADASKSFVDGSAGATDEEKDILRSVYGRVAPLGPVPPFVQEYGASRMKVGADCVSCMFAVHYFFEAPDKFNGFLKNLGDTMKVGSYFIGCCFDGEKVFELLRGTPKGGKKVGIEKDAMLWSITKQYDEDDMPEGDDAFGLPIDVEFASIGTEQREYLVPFKLLEEKLKLIGCELLTTEELKELGMVNSTALFGASWEMAKKQGQNYTIPESLRQFSFMNRWFIFKRKRQESAATAAVAAAEMAAAAAGVVANAPAAANAVAAAAVAPATPVAGRNANIRKNAAAVSAAASAINAAAAAAPAPAPAAPANAAANAAAAAQAQAAPRTLPVAAGPGAAPEKRYTLGEVFTFYADAALKDVLGINDKGAGRWLAPLAPFPLDDSTDPEVKYPSVEHYIAAMRVKVASDKPELAKTLFSREGTIHQKFHNLRMTESVGGTKPIPEARDYELLKEETAEVKDYSRAPMLKRYKCTVDEAKWAAAKDQVLRDALTQRWTRDARFRRIVEAARDKGKFLLYYTPGAATSNVGGIRRTDGRIEGENRMGKVIMELAGYPA